MSFGLSCMQAGIGVWLAGIWHGHAAPWASGAMGIWQDERLAS
jgi:hypothetical protein